MPIERKQKIPSQNVGYCLLGILAIGAIVGLFIAVSDDSNVAIKHSGLEFVNISSSSTTGK